MSDEDTQKERIKMGVNFLDEIEPDWFNKVNLDTFDWNYSDANFNGDSCVLSQVFGWKDGREKLRNYEKSENNHPDGDATRLEEYGFYPPSDFDFDSTRMTELWRKEILDKRSFG